MKNAALSSSQKQGHENQFEEHGFPEPVDVITPLRPVNQLPIDAIEKLAEVTEKYPVPKGRSIVDVIKDRSFVYYLITGSLNIVNDGKTTERITSDQDDTKNALDRRIKESSDVVAAEPCILAKIPWGKLEDLLLQFAPSNLDSALEVMEILTTPCSDWMVRLLQSELLSGLPAANIQQVMSGVEPIQIRKDELIIQQGDAPDHFYIIEKGKFSVIRHVEKSGRDVQLATLKAGDFFGEEALITGNERGTSVTAASDGMLLKLHGDTFTQSIVEPTVARIDADEALKQVNSGAILLDVREPERFASGALPGSENLVLKLLRINSNHLDKSFQYVTAADEPNAAALAAFLLRVRGFDVSSLDVAVATYAKVNNLALETNLNTTAKTTTKPARQDELLLDNAVGKPTLEQIKALDQEHAEIDADPINKEDYAHTVTGIGLANLIEELHGAGNQVEGSNEISEDQTAEPQFADLHSQIGAEDEFEGNLSDTLENPIKRDNSKVVKLPVVHVDNSNRAEIDRLVAKEVEKIRGELRREMETELAKQKRAALMVLKNQQHKLVNQYRLKQQALIENSKKLIALANKISRQKAEVQAARQSLAEAPEKNA